MPLDFDANGPVVDIIEVEEGCQLSDTNSRRQGGLKMPDNVKDVEDFDERDYTVGTDLS